MGQYQGCSIYTYIYIYIRARAQVRSCFLVRPYPSASAMPTNASSKARKFAAMQSEIAAAELKLIQAKLREAELASDSRGSLADSLNHVTKTMKTINKPAMNATKTMKAMKKPARKATKTMKAMKKPAMKAKKAMILGAVPTTAARESVYHPRQTLTEAKAKDQTLVLAVLGTRKLKYLYAVVQHGRKQKQWAALYKGKYVKGSSATVGKHGSDEGALFVNCVVASSSFFVKWQAL